jgi:uncharacterized protein YaaN involved in tellurite resistance
MTRITEADIETMVEVEQMEIREAIAKYHKWKDIADRLEGELSHAENELQDAIERLDLMGVVEYE